jgi:ATP-dependent RNA helicase DeaD
VALLRGARINAAWIDAPTSQAIRAQDRERLLAALLAPAAFDEEDRALARRLLAERSPEDIAAALVRAHRAAMPEPEEMIENTPEARRAAPQERHRAGFEDVVWFRIDTGRRQNADPRWLLPLLCRRGHITRNEVGAIRIGADETHFQVPRAIAGKFQASLARTAGDERDQEDVRIEPSDGPRTGARGNRDGGPRSSAPPHRPFRPGAPKRKGASNKPRGRKGGPA